MPDVERMPGRSEGTAQRSALPAIVPPVLDYAATHNPLLPLEKVHVYQSMLRSYLCPVLFVWKVRLSSVPATFS